MQIEKCNPLAVVHDSLLSAAKGDLLLSKYIKSGNFIDLENPAGFKKSVTNADLPELLLIQPTFEEMTENTTSSGFGITVQYDWVCTTGTMNPYLVMSIGWQLYKITKAWCKTLGNLQFEEKPFVKNSVLGSVSTTLEDIDNNRGIIGWTLVLPLVVELVISRNDIGVC